MAKKRPRPPDAPAARPAKVIPLRRPDAAVGALGRLDCELTRDLSAPPGSPALDRRPTWAEVAALLQFGETTVNRWADEDPRLGMVATVLGLLRHHLTTAGREARLDLLEKFAERLFHALRLRGTGIGDRIEDRLGHAGKGARAGRRLAWLAARLLALELGRDLDTIAWNLAQLLSSANGSAGIIDETPRSRLSFPRWWAVEAKRLEKLQRAIKRKLRRRAQDGRGELVAALRTNATLREELAREVVIAAAAASGYERPRERLFGAYQKQLRRRRSEQRTAPTPLSAALRTKCAPREHRAHDDAGPRDEA